VRVGASARPIAFKLTLKLSEKSVPAPVMRWCDTHIRCLSILPHARCYDRRATQIRYRVVFGSKKDRRPADSTLRRAVTFVVVDVCRCSPRLRVPQSALRRQDPFQDACQGARGGGGGDAGGRCWPGGVAAARCGGDALMRRLLLLPMLRRLA